jgi:hypothetical protein
VDTVGRIIDQHHPLWPFSQSWQRSALSRNASRAIGPRRTRLWHNQGRCADDRDLLAPIYGWFIEGFDTPDLKDTKALLDELT